jgi:hypothetical protein
MPCFTFEGIFETIPGGWLAGWLGGWVGGNKVIIKLAQPS